MKRLVSFMNRIKSQWILKPKVWAWIKRNNDGVFMESMSYGGNTCYVAYSRLRTLNFYCAKLQYAQHPSPKESSHRFELENISFALCHLYLMLNMKQRPIGMAWRIGMSVWPRFDIAAFPSWHTNVKYAPSCTLQLGIRMETMHTHMRPSIIQNWCEWSSCTMKNGLEPKVQLRERDDWNEPFETLKGWKITLKIFPKE